MRLPKEMAGGFQQALKLLGVSIALVLWEVNGELPAFAQSAPAANLADFDRRHNVASAPRPKEVLRQAARDRLRATVPEVQIAEDSLLGSPRWIRSARGFLSGPDGQGRGVPAAALRAVPANDPYRPIKAFLNEHPEVFGHDARALDRARLTRRQVAAHNGLQTFVWQQELDGLPVFAGLLISHLTRQGELVSVSSHFVPEIEAAARRGHPRRARGQIEDGLTAAQAIAQAAASLGDALEGRDVRPRPHQPQSPRDYLRFSAPGMLGEVAARRVWLPWDGDTLRLSWEVILKSARLRRMFRVVLDAETGAAMVRHNLSSHLSDATYRVFTSDSPTPMSPGHPTPLNSQPPLVPRAVVTLTALDTNASPQGWVPDGINETRGNNVDAYLDRDGDEQPDQPRPQGMPPRTFDFPFDPALPPAGNAHAALVQVFYWCNWMHDQLYALGFTEAAGNFQNDNFGRGGLGGDAVLAEVQDGDLFNNSNFDAASEGLPGRMQIGVFTSATPDRDSAFDAEVVLHEYTHGLSGRLVGGGVGLTELQARGLSEGWSDFYALAMLSEPDDDPEGNYAMGAYVAYGNGGFSQNYYFGYRRYPYTTATNRNPLTLKDIDPTQFTNHPGIPRNPLTETLPADNIYCLGELWAVTLWEIRAKLIRKHGFATGNSLALQLVTDGLKLTPANPNFLEARDAILMADQINGGTNLAELWAAFAKRGLGVSAWCPPSRTTYGVQQAFDGHDDLSLYPWTGFTASGPVGGPFSPASRTFTLFNISTNPVVWAATNGSAWLSLSATNGTLTALGQTSTVTAALSAAAYSLPAGLYTNRVGFTNYPTGVGQTLEFVLRIGQPDPFTEIFERLENDLDYTSFTFTPDGSVSFYTVCREAITNLPTDPAGGLPVPLAGAGFAPVTLTGGQSIAFYGQRYTNFFIGANGYLTFGQGDDLNSPSLANHFQQIRLAALFTHLNPAGGGAVSWQPLADRVAVTFANVPEFGTNAPNTFQIELFFDGRIRLSYLHLSARDGLVGFSRGLGTPANFYESDFSAYPGCAEPLGVELPPFATEGDGLLALQGQIVLPRAVATNLIVHLSSSEPGELVPTNLVTVPAGATHAQFHLWVLDDGELDGTQIVTVTASADGLRRGTDTIRVHDNESATLGISGLTNVTESVGLLAATVTVTAPPARSVTVELATSYTDEIDVPPSVLIPAGQTSAVFYVTVYDDDEIDGLQSASITAHVVNWTDGVLPLAIQDNEDTLLRLSVPSQVHENDGLLPNAGTVRLAGWLSTNLNVTLVADRPADLAAPAAVTLVAGQTWANFDLTPQDNVLANDPVRVTISATAVGFQGAGGVVTVLDDEVPAAPTHPDPPDLATNVPIYWNLAWGIPDRELMVNGGFETGTFLGWYKESSPRGDFYLNNGSFDPTGGEGPQPPLTGNFSVVSAQEQHGERLLYQDVALPGGAGPVALRWAQRVTNAAPAYGPDQQFRVEIRDLTNGVLALAFRTEAGYPLFDSAWTNLAFDLSGFKGRTVRIAFVETDSQAYLNVHLDNVSVLVPPDPAITYDVYFGTNATPGAAEFLTNTPVRYLNLENLSPLTTYYWQIVARSVGQVPGPVWRFTTWGPDRLDWRPIASPQGINTPVPVLVTARDRYGNVVTNFTGPVALALRVNKPDVIINQDSGTSPYPLAASRHDARSQVIYLAGELGAAQQFTALALEVIAAPGGPLTNWTIRLKHTDLDHYPIPQWETAGWTTVYQHNETIVNEDWVTFPFSVPFDYNGESHLMIDFSFNNAAAVGDGACRMSQTETPRGLHFQTDSLYGDPLSWLGATPTPTASDYVPSIKLVPGKPALPLVPTASGLFVDGTWTGFVSVAVPGTNLSLSANYHASIPGESGPFNVSADRDADGLPDEWEDLHGLDPENAADRWFDLDGDGMNALAEFLANTDPNDPGSVLRVISLAPNSASVHLQITTAPGVLYLVQRTLQLGAAASWTNVAGPLAGTGALREVTDSQAPAGTTCFYRIQVLR